MSKAFTPATLTALNKIRQHGYADVLSRGRSYSRGRIEVSAQALQPLLDTGTCFIELDNAGRALARLSR